MDIDKLIKEHKLIVAKFAQPGLFRKQAPKRQMQSARKVQEETIPEARREASESSSGQEDNEVEDQADKAEEKEGQLSDEDSAKALAWGKLTEKE